MEVSVGDYGRMMFEMMVGQNSFNGIEHWSSIKSEAEPLVRKLLALNNKMSNGGYTIHGYLAESEKQQKVLSKWEKIEAAQKRVLVPTSTLQEGDKFWLFYADEYEMFVHRDDPATVEDVTKKAVYYEIRGHHNGRLNLDDQIIKAPDCFKKDDEDSIQQQEEFKSDAYWLKVYESIE